MVRKYEVAFLLKEGEIGKAIIERIKGYLSKVKGTLLGENDMGTRQLAYPIHRNREDFHRAFYYFIKAELETTVVVDLEKQIKFDEDIIRYMVVVEE